MIITFSAPESGRVIEWLLSAVAYRQNPTQCGS